MKFKEATDISKSTIKDSTCLSKMDGTASQNQNKTKGQPQEM